MTENKDASITDHQSASWKKGTTKILTGMSVPLDRGLLMGDPESSVVSFPVVSFP
jgi:hypothetical protein